VCQPSFQAVLCDNISPHPGLVDLLLATPTCAVGCILSPLGGWIECSADDLFFQGDGASAAGWALDTVAELADVNLQFADGATQGVAVHSQFACGAALVAFVFLKNGQDKAFLELAHSLGIKNVASVHLQNQCFQLVFHDGSLSLL
jgi:hypothetical protein